MVEQATAPTRTPGTLGQRMKRRRLELNLSQTELAIDSGLTQPTISALEKDRSKSSGSVASIAKVLMVSALWLETGLGDPQATTPVEVAPDTYTVPLLDVKGSCGNGRLYGDVDYAPIAISTHLLKKYHANPANLIALYADGDSMANFIVHCDVLLFDTAVSDFKDGGIYLIDTPDGLRVKRINRRADGRVVLRSDNPDKTRYPDEDYTVEQAPLLAIKGRFVLRIGG